MLTGRITLTSHGVKIKGKMQINIEAKEIRIFNNKHRVVSLMLGQVIMRKNIKENHDKPRTNANRFK